MSLTIIIPCSTTDVDYLFEWFGPFVYDNRFGFRYLIILNGDVVPQCCQELDKLEFVTIIYYDEPLYPGRARNIALDYIDDGHLAFIDARTIFTANWLKFAFSISARKVKIATYPSMPLATSCRELQEISALLVEEHRLVRLMRRCGEAPCVTDEAMAYAGGISQLALMLQPMLLAALDLELEAACVA